MIREVYQDEVHAVATMMKGFEQETEHVLVDIEYTTKVYQDLMDKGVAHFFVLEDEGKMIGGLLCIKAPDLHYPRTIAVETAWYVHPDYRGRGLELLDYFENWAKENGCDKTAMIHLADSMPESLERLYKKRGYKLLESHYIRTV